MKRIAVSALLVSLFVILSAPFATTVYGEMPSTTVLSQRTLAPYGMTRAWFDQAQVGGISGQILNVLLDRGTLFVQSDQGALTAIDAETGERLWAVQVGEFGRLVQQPSANSRVVAMVNGMVLYVLNRHTGEVLWMRRIDEAVGAGCELSEEYVFVPTVNAMMYAFKIEQEPLQLPSNLNPDQEEVFERNSYRLMQEPSPPLATQGVGRCFVQPVVARHGLGVDVITWVTDRGYMYMGYIDQSREEALALRYRVGVAPKTVYYDRRHFVGQEMPSSAEINVRPTYRQTNPEEPASESYVYVASTNGVVFAVNDRTGKVVWEFTTGKHINQRLAVIGDQVFVPVQEGGMHCIDALKGEEIWFAPNVKKFVAMSNHRLYVLDMRMRLAALSLQSGARYDTFLDAAGYKDVLFNLDTDRIYLTTTTGLVQCLREVELDTPIVHRYGIEDYVAEEALAEEPVDPLIPNVPPVNPQPPTGTDPFAPQPPTGTDPFAPQPPTGTDPFAPQPPTGTDPFAPQPPTGTDPFAPQPPTGTDPFAPQPPTGTDPFAPQPPTGTDPLAPQPPTGTDPLAPQPPTGTDPFAPQPPTGTDPFAPQPPTGTDPFAPQPPTGTDPFAPQPPTGTDPFAPQPPTGTDPFGGPATPEPAPATGESPFGGTDPFGGPSAPAPAPATGESPFGGTDPFGGPSTPAPAPTTGESPFGGADPFGGPSTPEPTEPATGEGAPAPAPVPADNPFSSGAPNPFGGEIIPDVVPPATGEEGEEPVPPVDTDPFAEGGTPPSNEGSPLNQFSGTPDFF
jgi:outer membrane protein assembly factor BamB